MNEKHPILRKFPNLDHTDITKGQTIEVSRLDYADFSKYSNPVERALAKFLHTIAEDPNIEAVAISGMPGHGIFTDWFINQLIRNHPNTIRTLDVIDKSYLSLREIPKVRAGYGTFTHLNGTPFDQAEARFRVMWDKVDEDNPFSFGQPHGQGLDLLTIIHFNDKSLSSD